MACGRVWSILCHCQVSHNPNAHARYAAGQVSQRDLLLGDHLRMHASRLFCYNSFHI